MKYEFDGISTEQFNITDKDLFYDFYETILISKDSFQVELDSKSIDLHLYIEDIDMADFDDVEETETPESEETIEAPAEGEFVATQTEG